MRSDVLESLQTIQKNGSTAVRFHARKDLARTRAQVYINGNCQCNGRLSHSHDKARFTIERARNITHYYPSFK